MVDDLFRLLLLLLFLKRTLLQTAPPLSTCPEAYVMDNGSSSCYKLVRSKSHYYTANNECKKDGGILVEIGNEAEDRFIWSQFYNTTRQLFWIGLSDADREGIFQWEHDGMVLDGYDHWAAGQPTTINGGVNTDRTNCVVYNGTGWLLSNCVTSLHNYLCEAELCESMDDITCTSQQPTSQSDDSRSSTPIIIVIVVMVIVIAVAGVTIILYLMYKKCNGVFMKYICCCACTNNQDEVLSLQHENQRLRHELSQHKLQLSASPSHNELTRGWSKQELLSGIPDGKGGYLPAIRQSPIGITSPTLGSDPPPLNKSYSGARVAAAPFIPQPRTQTPSSPFISHPASHSSLSRPLTGVQLATTPATVTNNNNDTKENKQ